MPVRWGRDDDTLSKMWQSRQGAGGSYHQLDSFTPGFSRLRDGSRAKADLQDTTAEDLWSGTDPRHLRASPLQDTPPRVPVRRQSPAKAQAASLLRRTFQPLNRGSPGPLKAQPVKCSIPSPPLPSKSPESTAQATSIASSPAPELCLRLPVPEHLQAVNSRPADPVPFKGFQQQPPVSPPTRLQAQPAGTAGRPADALPTAAHQPAAPGSPAATAHSQSGEHLNLCLCLWRAVERRHALLHVLHVSAQRFWRGFAASTRRSTPDTTLLGHLRLCPRITPTALGGSNTPLETPRACTPQGACAQTGSASCYWIPGSSPAGPAIPVGRLRQRDQHHKPPGPPQPAAAQSSNDELKAWGLSKAKGREDDRHGPLASCIASVMQRPDWQNPTSPDIPDPGLDTPCWHAELGVAGQQRLPHTSIRAQG